MKKSVILEIFNGTKGNIDTMNDSRESGKDTKISRDIYDELKEKLNPETFKLHDKYIETVERDWLKEVDYYFIQGFKLGLLVGIECMEE